MGRKAQKRESVIDSRIKQLRRMVASRKDRAWKVPTLIGLLKLGKPLTMRKILDAQGRSCFYCGEPIGRKKATVDHFYPKSKGFGRYGNTVLACSGCNSAKGSRMPHEHEREKFEKMYGIGGSNGAS